MAECFKYGAAVVTLVACLTLVVTEDMQNAGAASFQAEIPDILWDMPKLQVLPPLQQKLGAQYSHLAAKLHAVLTDKIDSSSTLPLAGPGLASRVGLFAGDSDGEPFRLKKSEATEPFLVSDERTEPDFLMGVQPLLDDETILLHSSSPGLTPYLSAQEFKETFRRSNPYFLGKRARYVSPDDDMLLDEDKRKAPIFVGRRSPQDTVEEIDDDSMFPDNYLSEDSGGSLGMDKTDTLTFGERSDVNGSFILPVKSPYTSLGLIIKAMESENVMGLTFEQKRRAPKFVGRRRAPAFVGKRRSPKFIGKRLSGVNYPDEDLARFEDKRRSPKFVGKRGFSYFLDKRGAPRFVGKRGAPRFVGKRGSPRFVGKRGAPRFVGKRGSPRFVGKRGAPRFVGKRGAPRFVGKRGAPRFVGKRGAPRFIGKRVKEWDEDSVSEEKRRAPKFVGRGVSAPYFVGKRSENSDDGKYAAFTGTFDRDTEQRQH